MKRILIASLWAAFAVLMGCLPASAQNAEYKLMHRGNIEFKARRYARAAACYMQAIKRNPDNARAVFNLADTYLAQGNAKAADSLYTRVTQLEKNKQVQSMAWHNRGYICQTAALHDPQNQQQLLRQAIEHYKHALRLNPRDNETRYNLALCQRQLKKGQGGGGGNKNQQNKQQQQQQQKGGQNQSQQRQQQQQQQQNQQEQQQTEQYINLARQAERRALEKLNGQRPRQKSLDKNW